MTKYRTRDEISKLGLQGKAFRLADGSYALPIEDYQDLAALRMCIEGYGLEEQEIRYFIIRRAKALGHSNLIPLTWNSVGSCDPHGPAFHY